MVAEEALLTVEEINQRLPLVRSIVKDIIELHADVAFRKQRLHSLRERHPASKSNSVDSVYEQEVEQMESELTQDEARIGAYSQELLQIGGTLTDPATGRVDFVGELAGERVNFCWQSGEQEILFWHSGVCDTSQRISLFQELGSSNLSAETPVDQDVG